MLINITFVTKRLIQIINTSNSLGWNVYEGKKRQAVDFVCNHNLLLILFNLADSQCNISLANELALHCQYIKSGLSSLSFSQK